MSSSVLEERAKQPSRIEVILDELNRRAALKLPGIKNKYFNQRILGSKWLLVWSRYWSSFADDDYGVDISICPTAEAANRRVKNTVYVTTSTKCGEGWSINYADDAETLGELVTLRKEFPTNDLSRKKVFELFDRLLDLTIKDSTPQYEKEGDKEKK